MVNGEGPFKFVVDTGASLSVIDQGIAEKLGLEDGGTVRLSTKRGSAEVAIESSDRMQPGHISLPNGLGVDYPDAEGVRQLAGVAPNELTASEDRDWLAGTPGEAEADSDGEHAGLDRAKAPRPRIPATGASVVELTARRDRGGQGCCDR